ncbi:MAG: ACP S-malonyltransferase, partial [Firmicutes bacterium]|nr:ACP S-malonyltransferase [Bacillota bacterium]
TYGDDIQEVLAKQICNPVLWETIVRNMISAGADTFIELGPGKTLCGLISKTDKSVSVYGIAEYADLEAITAEVSK